MFEKFLKQYVKDLIDCEYGNIGFTEDEIMEVVFALNNNEDLWQFMDTIAYNQIDKIRRDKNGKIII